MRLLPLNATRSVRVSTAEAKMRTTKVTALLLTVVNIIGITVAVSLFLSLHDILDQRSGVELMQQIRDDYGVYQALEREAREKASQVRRLEASLDLDSTEDRILAIADLLFENERDYQLFYRLLKVNMYHLTTQIPGSTSWYEIYGPEIDQAIERSRARQLQLLQIRLFYEDA